MGLEPTQYSTINIKQMFLFLRTMTLIPQLRENSVGRADLRAQNDNKASGEFVCGDELHVPVLSRLHQSEEWQPLMAWDPPVPKL